MLENIRKSNLWNLISPMKQIYKNIEDFGQGLDANGIKGIKTAYSASFGRKKIYRDIIRNSFPSQEVLKRQREESNQWTTNFSIVTPLYNTNHTYLKEMIESVQAQSYTRWELILADASDADDSIEEICQSYLKTDSRIKYKKLESNKGISANTNAAIAMVSGDYIVFMDHDDRITPNALYENAKVIKENGADFLYSDEAVFQKDDIYNVSALMEKPGFAIDDLRALNYICHLTVVSKDIVDELDGLRSQFDGSQDHDFVLRATEKAKSIYHIPRVLYLWRSSKTSVASGINKKNYAAEAGLMAVEESLKRQNIDATVRQTDIFPTVYRVDYKLSDEIKEDITRNDLESVLAIREYEGTLSELIDKHEENSNSDSRLKPSKRFVLYKGSDYKLPSEQELIELIALATREDVLAAGAMLIKKNGRVEENGRKYGNILDAGAGKRQLSYLRSLAYVRDVDDMRGCFIIDTGKNMADGNLLRVVDPYVRSGR